MLPSYKSRRRPTSKGISVINMITFLKSPGIRRIWYILLLLPVPIITFFLGKFSSPVIRPSIDISSFNAAINGSHRKTLAPDKNWDRFAFALKTGKDVALKRTPIQLMTFLKPVNNIILIGEEPNVFVADYPMIDVVSATLKGPEIGHGNLISYVLVKAPKMQHDSSQGHLLKRALEEVTVDQDSKGWKLDAKKNIPGFRLLYEKFPDADWYVMIDDDTYMFMDNVLNRLKKLNPNDPHYVGAPSNFIGCDGITKWGDSIYFAHGGSGIIISRGAMLKMIPLVDGCIEKYDSCWAGDIRTSLCLRDAGIFVENGGYFSPVS
jgi:Fringe-like